MSKSESIHTALFLFCFSSLVLLGSRGLFEVDQVSQENRQLAPLPAMAMGANLLSWPEEFEAYAQDHFGGRSTLVAAQNRLDLAVFNESSNDRVLVGTDGWLFLKDEQVLADLRGEALLTDAELAEWQHHLEERRDWLAGQGIEYLFVIVPNKRSVYPEYLPSKFQPKGMQRRSQLVAHLITHSDVPVVDLTNFLVSKKADELLYYKHDTHWTDTAAFLGYEYLARRLGLKPFDRRKVDREKRSAHLAVLSRFMALEDVLPDDEYVYLYDEHPQAYLVQSEIDDTVIYGRTEEGLPQLLMYRDSFADALISWLAEHFSHSVFLRRPQQRVITQVEINRYQPDIIIEQIVEGKLLSVPVPN